MREILDKAIEALDKGQRVALITILTLEGSAPRGPGACLLAGAEGPLAGTVGGGAVEGRALDGAKQVLATGLAQVEQFHLTPGDAAGLGMVCGGQVRLLTQVLTAEDLPLLRQMQGKVRRREICYLVTQVGEGWARMSLAEEGPQTPTWQQGQFIQPLIRPGRALIYGGGHVARALAALLVNLDFDPLVMDDRPEFADPARFPGAQARLVSFDDPVPAQAEDFVVIMTRGHQHDYQVLCRALGSPARYIGLIGSRHKIAATRDRLLAEGFTQADFDRVHTPIGLAIGAQTPQEIAVSIAAQMIACRAGVTP